MKADSIITTVLILAFVGLMLVVNYELREQRRCAMNGGIRVESSCIKREAIIDMEAK